MNLKKILILIFLIPIHLFASVDFDSVNDYLDCSTGLTLEKNDMSLTSWVLPVLDSEPYPRGTIVSHVSDGGGFNLEMYLDDGSASGSIIILSCDLMDSGGTVFTASVDFGDVAWKHVACIWDGTDLTPYVAGQPGTPWTIGSAADINDGKLYIGSQDGAVSFFHGQISDVSYYRRVLSVSEIETMAYSRMRGDVIPSNLRDGYWPLDDLHDGTTVHTSIFLNRASPGTNNCVGSGVNAGGTAYADILRYK